MKNSFIYKFTNNDSLIDNILKKYKMEEIIKNPYSLIEFINLDEIDKVITNDKSFNELEEKLIVKILSFLTNQEIYSFLVNEEYDKIINYDRS